MTCCTCGTTRQCKCNVCWFWKQTCLSKCCGQINPYCESTLANSHCVDCCSRVVFCCVHVLCAQHNQVYRKNNFLMKICPLTISLITFVLQNFKQNIPKNFSVLSFPYCIPWWCKCRSQSSYFFRMNNLHRVPAFNHQSSKRNRSIFLLRKNTISHKGTWPYRLVFSLYQDHQLASADIHPRSWVRHSAQFHLWVTSTSNH